MKRRGNRRYYQRHEVLMIRRIRELLYEQGFTISGARNKLQELVLAERNRRKAGVEELLPMEVDGLEPAGLDRAVEAEQVEEAEEGGVVAQALTALHAGPTLKQLQQLRQELFKIRELLTV